MNNPNTTVTLIEAAQLMGVSTQTVRRLIQKKALPATQSLGLHGLRWEIHRSDLARYLEANRGGQQPISVERVDQGQHHHAEPRTSPANPHTRGVDDGHHVDDGQQPQQVVPLAAHLAALDLAKSQMEYLQRQAESSQLQAEDLQRQAEESLRAIMQAERAKYSLEAQLAQYQRVLAESAESLAEERAMRLAAEAKALEVEARPVEVAQVSSAPEPLTDTPTKRRGWGSRLKGWLLGDRAV